MLVYRKEKSTRSNDSVLLHKSRMLLRLGRVAVVSVRSGRVASRFDSI